MARDQDEAVGLLRGDLHLEDQQERHVRPEAGSAVGSDNTYTESITELKAGIVGNLSMVLGYTYKHNSDVEIDTSLVPPRPFDKTDTYTTISLEYGF